MNYQKVEYETSFGTSGQLPPSSIPEFAFAGRSNVGKSSMLNKLFNRKALARVSATPGKTATINFYTEGSLRFVDLPGYGYAKAARSELRRWGELVEGYFAQDRDLRLVFSLIDMRHPPTTDDLAMLNFLIDRGLPFVVVLTKADKLNKTQRANRLEALKTELPEAEQLTVIPFSTQTGEGVEQVKAIIAQLEDGEQAQPKE